MTAAARPALESIAWRTVQGLARLAPVALVAMCALVPHLGLAGGPADAPAAQPPTPLKSGLEFAGAEVQALQADDFANPGMLWVVRGKDLWQTPPAPGVPTCAGCHGEAETAMRGVAASYPKIAGPQGDLHTLSQRINRCRVGAQGAVALPDEADDLLGLTAYVAFQSRGLPQRPAIDGPARSHFEAGRAYFVTRRGQMNLACTHCHQDHWGRRLLGETISQGHGNAYPAYRLEWQALGSLQRRLRNCLAAVRAEPPRPESPEWAALELFLAWRAQALPIETPGVRR